MKTNKTPLLWIVAAVLLAVMIASIQVGPAERQTEITYSDFLAQVEEGGVAEVTIQGQDITGRLETGEAFRTFAPTGTDIVGP